MSSGDLTKRTIINNCYILRERIGSDMFSEIWIASALFSATEFIVRFLRDDLPQELLEAERRLVVEAYDVRHTAILDVVEMDRIGSTMFISTENNRLSTLDAVHRSGASFSLDHICGFILELSGALDAFHRRGIVYGTVNAESVFVSMEAGIVSALKLMKPGYLPLLGALPAGDKAFALRNHGFLAPECKGVTAYAVDARADAYSLGILLYWLVTGLMPFRGQSADKARDKSVSIRHVSNALLRRDVPPELARIAVTCVRRNPKLRYDGMVDLIRDLKQFLDSRRIESIRSGVVDPLADLEHLNTVKASNAAEQVIRTIDMAVYFQALADGIGSHSASMSARRFPVMSPASGDSGASGPDDIEELEALEEIESGEEDDDDLRAEDYVAKSLEELGSSGPGNEAARGPAPRPAGVPASISMASVSEPLLAAASDGAAILERSDAVLEEPPGKKTRIVWRLEKVGFDAITASLSAAFESARGARGTFSFIEKPPAGSIGTAVFEVLSGIAGRGTLLSIPAGDGSAEGFSASFRSALEGQARAMTRGARRRYRVFAPQAIEALDRALSSTRFDDGFGSGNDARLYDDAALALARVATRSRPVALVIESGSYIDQRVLAYMDALARIAGSERLCVFAFFEGVPPVPATPFPAV